MKMRNFSGLIIAFAAAALLAPPLAAHAQMTGTKILTAFGGAIDGTQEDGHMALAGVVTLTGNGGASMVNVTVTYQDSRNDDDGTVCTFTQPGDLSYSFPNGLNAAGTLTLTLNSADPNCYEMADPGNTGNETGFGVAFTVYARNGSAAIVGAATTLVDPDLDILESPVTTTGTLTAASGGLLNSLLRGHLMSALGGTTDAGGDSGHMGIAGRVAFNAKGGANSLDAELSYIDSTGDAIGCELTTASDLSYSLSKGVGTLTLTVGSGDSSTCSLTAGESITFSAYAVGGTTALIATASSLGPPDNETIDSLAMSGSF